MSFTQAHDMLEKEMLVVKEGMGHGELSAESYAQVKLQTWSINVKFTSSCNSEAYQK